jgi:hypothetical protein
MRATRARSSPSSWPARSAPAGWSSAAAAWSSIGVKLLLHWGHLQHDSVPQIATSTSLLVILVVLTVTVVASVLKSRRNPGARAHAGSLRQPREARRPS